MDNVKIESYKDLIVWQKAVELVTAIYKLTDQFPREEIYGLTSQMRRSSVSIPSNIAEGKRRGTQKDYRQFLIIAFGSGSELETQLLIARNLAFINSKDTKEVDRLLDEIMRMLNVLIAKLK
ncbi:MAG: four helix bundle protein [Parcubacteria group bacterium]|nr:four helix bundle protein [Parcubacteria group bacterium]